MYFLSKYFTLSCQTANVNRGLMKPLERIYVCLRLTITLLHWPDKNKSSLPLWASGHETPAVQNWVVLVAYQVIWPIAVFWNHALIPITPACPHQPHLSASRASLPTCSGRSAWQKKKKKKNPLTWLHFAYQPWFEYRRGSGYLDWRGAQRSEQVLTQNEEQVV